MAIRLTYDPQLKILVATAEGLVFFEEILKHLDEEAHGGELGYPEIFDASAASTNLTYEEVNKLVGRVHEMMRRGPFGPTAVVTTNDLFFGMARMFATLCDLQGGPQVEAFRSFREGLDWLRMVSAMTGQHGNKTEP